jgi:hypothetical protein
MGWGSYSYAFGPVIALGVLGLLVVLLRWTMRRGGSVVQSAGRADEYGVLTPVASPPDYVRGELLRRQLEDAGIRANLTTTLDGPRILVFPGDAERARQLLGPLA